MFRDTLRILRNGIRSFLLWLMTPEIKMFVVPGGREPERKTGGAVGYDAYIRAIILPDEMDNKLPYLRKTLFDFQNTWDESITKHVYPVEGTWIYRLKPGQRVFVGLGVIIDMDFPLFYLVIPRSGLEIRLGITLANHAPIDSDYRGEAGALIENLGNESFDLEYGMKIAQIVFHSGVIPNVELVSNYKNLSTTERGTKGYGSTGYKA